MHVSEVQGVLQQLHFQLVQLECPSLNGNCLEMYTCAQANAHVYNFSVQGVP